MPSASSTTPLMAPEPMELRRRQVVLQLLHLVVVDCGNRERLGGAERPHVLKVFGANVSICARCAQERCFHSRLAPRPARLSGAVLRLSPLISTMRPFP